MSILQQLPPPSVPRSVPKDWNRDLPGGVSDLPSDYVEFVERYGTGAINDFLYVLVPGAGNSYLNLSKQYTRQLRSLADVASESPGTVPYRAHPEPGGLIPWAITDNGDVCFWATDGDVADKWTVVVCDGRMWDWQSYPLGTIEFIRAVLSRQLECAVFPPDFILAQATFSPI